MQGKDINIRRDAVPLAEQTHLGREAGGQALVTECGADLSVRTERVGLWNDSGFVKAFMDAVSLGALVEHCFFTAYYNRTPIEVIAQQIRAVGCENVILSTDFGQVKSPYSDEGMALYGEQLLAQGFTDGELRQMFCLTPARLLAEE